MCCKLEINRGQNYCTTYLFDHVVRKEEPVRAQACSPHFFTWRESRLHAILFMPSHFDIIASHGYSCCQCHVSCTLGGLRTRMHRA